VGKPYQVELESLESTYKWSLDAPISSPTNSWTRLCGYPLISIGSGGSFSAATLAAYLHEYHTGLPARALTPLDAALSSLNWSTASALVLTARGGNPDILGVFRRLAASEPKSIATICTRLQSPLSELVSEYTGAETFDIELPTGKDGFLATNSLLATSLILARLYADSIGTLSALPRRLDDLLCKEAPQMTSGSFETLWKSQTLITLYSPVTRAAAVDLESKFSEAAIGSLQAVDYRNFAHGRHHWLSRHRDSTGVIAFVADEVEDLSGRMLALLPRQVPTLRIRVPGEGARAAIAAMVHAIRIVGQAGIRGVPGSA
jgi:fructoselysine-6-P-deglycase FrlB-like protein